jgi:hypothetical protein
MNGEQETASPTFFKLECDDVVALQEVDKPGG